MRICQLAALAIGIGILTGCATQSGSASGPKTSCRAPSCSVSVVATIQTNPRSCKLDVTPPTLDLSGGQLTQQTIVWTLTVSVNGAQIPVTFSDTAIQFGSNASSVMSAPTISPNSVSVTYTRPSQGGNTYTYGVNADAQIANVIIAHLCSTDPWVVD
jgi:hypothetical protein